VDRADRTATGCGAGGDDGGGRDPADPGFFDDADEAGARVLVLFERAANRQHVADCLRPTYDVVTGESLDALDDTVDCCLVDAAAFARHHERLAADGERDPSAPPLLLVVDPDVLDSSGDRVWRRVDEVVTTPVSKAELLARVDALVERHSLVRRVARSEARFKSLFEAVPDPLFVVDDDGRVVAANAAFCDATGVVRADCLGDALRASEAFPEAAATRLEAAVADAPTRTPEQV
jgi:PAS domain-containing protein